MYINILYINILYKYKYINNLILLIKMLIDLLAIMLISILSLIFCINENNYKCLLSHIIVGLSVIVYYKLYKYILLNKTNTAVNKNSVFNKINVKNNSNSNSNSINENFESIQDFITDSVLLSDSLPSRDELHSLSNSQLQEYTNRLTELTNAINNASAANNTNRPQQNVSVSPDTIQKLDLESQQQYQMFQIDYLNKQLQQAKDNINANTISSSSNNYKPIKIYSSCSISNANGTTSVDSPVKLQFADVINSSQNKPNNNSSNNTQQTNQMLQTIGQSSPQQQTQQSNPLNLNQNTGIFNPLLNALFNNNTNTNIT